MSDLISRECVATTVREYLKSLLEKGIHDVEITEFNVDIQNIIEKLPAENEWILVEDELPATSDYVLLSFANFSLPAVGRYEHDEAGGAWYLGDCDEDDTCVANELFINAWMPLPEAYREVE